MRRLRFRLTAFVTAILAASLAASGTSSAEPQQKEIIVSAAISVKDALDEAKQIYVAENPGTSVLVNYGASGTLQLQIEQGAPVDVFLSAAPKQMDALEVKGLLLEATRKDLLRNEIVLIVPKDSALGISSFQDLTRPSVKKIALGEPAAVPAGEYAKEVLAKLGIYDAVNSKAVLAKDVRQVLTYVETGNVDAGIVYATDAESSSKVKVAAKAPPNSHAPVVYPVAVIKGSKDSEAAKRFVGFLSSSEAAAVFRRYGFELPSR
ncbi:MAG TPA: molybdate ABC transporter substrate-binding protein [Candidatus Acidoferrales bacterium]|nr:molybdate ABC transporter substrate-binding protein [Candidatus Acidoferrales bacterium]